VGRAARTLTVVHLSVVLRLRPDALARRELVGSVEVVDDGTVASVGSVDDLLDVLAAYGSPASAPVDEPVPTHREVVS
jgi:hypothetical protein